MQAISNPRWADAGQTFVVLDVVIEEGEDAVEYIARASDSHGGAALLTRALAGDFGEIAPYFDIVSPGPEQIIEAFRLAIQSHLDAAAVAKLYDSGNSLATYVTSTNPQWAAEAAAFVAWRDAVWVYAYAELNKVLTEQREQPSVEAFISELPVIEWPD